MKKVFKMTALMLCAAAMMTACNCNNSSCNTNENKAENKTEDKTAEFEKKAAEFKAALGSGNSIIGERIDANVQKVFYLDPNQDNYGYGANPINNIMMHDYATDQTQAILPETERITEYLDYGELVENKEPGFNHCFNLDYRSSEIIGDRLFMMIHTECSFEMETSLLFYVNLLDNTLHYVTDCDEVNYNKAKGTIDVNKELMKAAGADLSHDFTISASSTDKEYAAMRSENEEIENKLAEKWREENLD